MIAADLFQGVDLFQDLIVLSHFDPADIDHHIDLLRSVLQRLFRLKHFDRRRVVPVRKSDHGTDRHLLSEVLRSLLYERRRDADRRGPEFHRIIADLPDLFPGGRLL